MAGCKALVQTFTAGLILVSFFTPAFGKRGYLLTAPNRFFAGGRESLCITFTDVNFDLKIGFSIKNPDTNATYFLQKEIFLDGKGRCFYMVIPDMSTRKVNLHIESIDSDDYQIDATKKIYVEGKSLLTFVQTDKPIYKPGQTVKIRMLTMNRDLMVLEDTFPEAYIEDPSGSRIMQWLKVHTKKGLASLELSLSTEPVLGTWKIMVTPYGGHKETTTFIVEEYVLPKYEVVITAPEYVTIKAETISASVCAKYTYGKPVKGDLLAEICVWQPYASSRPCAVVKQKISGCADLTVNTSDLMLASSRWPLWNAKIKVYAEVLEDGTGVKMNKTSDVTRLEREVMRIHISDHSLGYFKPGLPYSGKVRVTWLNDNPVEGENVTLTIRNYQEKYLEKYSHITNDKGEFDFTVPTDNSSISSFYVEAIVHKYEYQYNSREHYLYTPRSGLYVRQWYSPSGSFLQLAPIRDQVTCGSTLKVEVAYTTPAFSNITFHYQLMSRANIVSTGHKVVTFGKPGKETETEAAEPDDEEDEEDHEEEDEEDDEMDSDTVSMIPELRGPTRPPPVILPGHLNQMSFDIPIIPKMSSDSAKLLLYYIRKDGEVVADSVTFKIQPCFKNKVSLSFSEAQKYPGDPVTVKVRASPGSLCSLGVADKSVHVLAGNNQLSKTKIFDSLSHFTLGSNTGVFDMFDCNSGWYGGGRVARFKRDVNMKRSKRSFVGSGHYTDFYDSSEAFKSSGMLVFSDLVEVKRKTCPVRPMYFYASSIQPLGSGGKDGPAGSVVPIRNYFPETWLWKLVNLGSEGQSIVETSVPHTITDWVGSAFCANPNEGFGVSPPVTLRAFQPFFASFSLPYSVIRGEKVPIIVSVFNYLSTCLVVRLELSTSQVFELDDKSNIVHMCVCGGQSNTHKFYITAEILGSLPITVKAKSVMKDEVCDKGSVMTTDVGARDAVTRTVIIEPEGQEEEYTYSTYMCLTEEENYISEEVHMTLPDDVIEGSARGFVSVIGDVMGPTLSGLDKLLRLPTGCGEQNMLKFAPNIYILQYLTNTNRLDPSIESKALQYLKTGYQRELTYRHDDGSYSAFGKRDEEGSMWLTAFVVKSFAQAKPFIYIDQMNIDMSITWFKSKQLENGCFPQVGTVHNKVMKGGLGEGRTPAGLTAYVLIAMLEAGLSREDPALEAAVRCLNKQYVKDSYTIALMAYAYTLYDRTSQTRMTYMDKLANRALENDGLTHWENDPAPPAPTEAPWWHHRAQSADVEMTSYALLAHVIGNRQEGVAAGIPVVRWLSKQRNPYGGFSSTQDTVVALQGLAQFASLAYRDGLKVKASVEGRKVNSSYTVTDITSLLLQTSAVPVPNDITLTAQGTGCVFMQATMRYNIPTAAVSAPAFTVTVNTFRADRNKDHCKRRSISICTRFNGPGSESNMAIVSVKMVSGWSPITQSLTQLQDDRTLELKKFEINDNVVDLYFDKLEVNTKCFQFNVEQTLEVEKIKPASVTVYDYYNTDLSVTKEYQIRITCGTKEELPFGAGGDDFMGRNGEIDWSKVSQRRQERLPILLPHLPDGPGVEVEHVDVDIRLENNTENTILTIVKPQVQCPKCLKQAPDDIVQKFCSSKYVYKTHKRRGRFPLRILADIRQRKKQKINKNAAWVMDGSCPCSVLTTALPRKKFWILSGEAQFTMGPKKTGTLALTDSSIIFPFKPLDEKMMRKGARRACK